MTTPALTAPIVAIEGIDGAGKNTLAGALEKECDRRGLSVGRLAFPRYGHVHADLISDVLHGRMTELAGLADSPHAMATLFALDRHAASADLDELRGTHDVVLLDRWVASSAAFTAAGLARGSGVGAAVFDSAFEWVRSFEFDRLGLAAPALQLLLATETEVAIARAESRESADSRRVRDRYERDGGLQRRTALAYARLAELEWVSPWRTVLGDPDVKGLTDEIETLLGGASRD